MIKAIIDIGSNTINLLIAAFSEGVFSILEDRKIHAKLARGGINNNTLTSDAIERGLEALREHKQLCDEYKISKADIVSYATASVRNANNGDEFVSLVKNNFGLNVKTIDGDTEALLIHYGIKNGFPLGKENVMVMDIGGGSVEFIITNKSEILWKKSFNVGVSKLLDMFVPSDPPIISQLNKVRSFIVHELRDLFVAIEHFKPEKLIGSSGSFDTIRAMIEAKNTNNDPEAYTWFEINRRVIYSLADQLSVITTEKRKKIPGMDAMRAEYFPLAFVLIKIVLEKMPKAKIYQCSYALKEGAFFYALNNQQ
jgi:exopolyphosphatase / guanosine-5'-triphosphate,3'-diphosphate pyrophosphatase